MERKNVQTHIRQIVKQKKNKYRNNNGQFTGFILQDCRHFRRQDNWGGELLILPSNWRKQFLEIRDIYVFKMLVGRL